MPRRWQNDSADSRDVFECVFEEHESHIRIEVVIFIQCFLNVELQFVVLVGHLIVESFSSNALVEVAEDQLFRVVLLNILV